jgi:transcription elongation factor GreA
MQDEKYILTKKGKIELEEELHDKVHVKRVQIIKSIKDAREQGDLSENADYSAAKEQQAQNETRIKEIEDILSHAQVIEETRSSSEKVKIGSKVTIRDFSENKDFTYEIVGEIEADPDTNKISNLSPLGKAIFGKPVGSTVGIHGLEEPYKIKILKINS